MPIFTGKKRDGILSGPEKEPGIFGGPKRSKPKPKRKPKPKKKTKEK